MLTCGQEEVRDRHEHSLGVRLCWDQGQSRTGGSGLGFEGFLGPLGEQLLPSPHPGATLTCPGLHDTPAPSSWAAGFSLAQPSECSFPSLPTPLGPPDEGRGLSPGPQWPWASQWERGQVLSQP